MLKNLSLITIICILAYSQVGYYFVLRHGQYQHRKAVKEKILRELKDEELTAIDLSDNKNIHWEEEGKEFLLNGEMYDVVKTRIINGKVILYSINDKKEKALIENYNSITKHNSSSGKKGKHTVDNSINLFVYPDNNSNEEYFAVVLNHFPSFVSDLRESSIDKISPPPKC